MRLLVKVRGTDAMIVGYAPGAAAPLAIVVMGGKLKSVKLDEIELLNIPHKLRHKLKKTIRRHTKLLAKSDEASSEVH